MTLRLLALALASALMAVATLAYALHRRTPEYAVVDGWVEPEDGLFV